MVPFKEKVIAEREASAMQKIREFMHVNGASLTPTQHCRA